MGAETGTPVGEEWFRGKSTALGSSRPGGNIDDFGDGVYFTDSFEVAQKYARGRTFTGGGQPEVLAVTIERSELGRVLDLTADSRWRRYLNTPLSGSNTPERLIRIANENYYQLFVAFLDQNGIDIEMYDSVIGPEFVRGGRQLCIRHRYGLPSSFARRILARLEPVSPPEGSGVKPTSVIPGQGLVKLSRLQGIVGNEAAMALLGQLIAAAIEYLGTVAVRMRVRHEIMTRHVKGIETSLARGEGVMIIIATYKTMLPDTNEKHITDSQFLSVSIEGGPTFHKAHQNWSRFPRLIPTPPHDMNRVEEFLWIDPAR